MFKIELAKINDLDRVKKIANDCALEMISRKFFSGMKTTLILKFLKKILITKIYMFTETNQ